MFDLFKFDSSITVYLLPENVLYLCSFHFKNYKLYIIFVGNIFNQQYFKECVINTTFI